MDEDTEADAESGEPKAKKEKKPFTLTLKSDEAAEILALDGKGPKKLIEYLQGQLADDNLKVVLNASQTGKIVQIVVRPGKAAFQNSLKKAFRRPLLARLSSH